MSHNLPEGLCQDLIKNAANSLFLILNNSFFATSYLLTMHKKNNSNVAHGWESYKAPGYELHQTGSKKMLVKWLLDISFKHKLSPIYASPTCDFFFHFVIVWRQYAVEGNDTSDFEFSSFPRLVRDGIKLSVMLFQTWVTAVTQPLDYEGKQ